MILTFNEYLSKRNEISIELDAISKILLSFPKGAMGLTLAIGTPEYRTAKKKFDVKFEELRNLNKIHVKVYKKQLQERQRVMRLYKTIEYKIKNNLPIGDENLKIVGIGN